VADLKITPEEINEIFSLVARDPDVDAETKKTLEKLGAWLKAAIRNGDHLPGIGPGKHFEAGVLTREFPVRAIPVKEFPVENRADPVGVTKPARRVRPPPGHVLLTITEFLFRRATFEQVIVPAVEDMRLEHCDALVQGRARKARWIHVRGVAGVILAGFLVALGDVLEGLRKAYRAVTG